VGAGLSGDFEASKHAGQFFDALFFAEHFDGGLRARLAYPQMMAAPRCHLGLVRDRQHLGMGTQGFQELAYNFCRAATNAHVRFVQYQGRGLR